MQLDDRSASLAKKRQQEYIPREIEVAIRSSLTVEDCIVIKRQTENFQQEFIAYVVPEALFAAEALLSHLQTILPSECLPTIVPVSALPLTFSGEIDKTALSHLEITDTDLAQQWEEQIKLVPKVKQVAVVVQEHLKQQQSLRLSDLLTEWKTLTSEESKTPVRTQLSHSTHNQDSSASRLAISHGGELKREKNAPKVLTQALQKTVVEFPDKQLIYIQSDGSQIVQSYQDLLLDAQKILAGLRKLGLKPLDKVIFQIPQSQDFIPAFWGCILGSFIPVPISIAPAYEQMNSAVSKLHSAWQMLKQPIVLTTSKLASSLEKLPKLLKIENFQVETVDNLRQNQPDSNIYQSQEDDLALILLTSGSTGFPKGVMLTHRNLLSMTAGKAQVNNCDAQDIILNWMPLEHVGAIVSLGLMAVDLGCTQIHVSTEYILQNPIRWLELIQRYKASISWVPNFAFSLLNERASEINQRSWDLSSMRCLVNGGEQIVPKTLRRALHLLQPHGLPSNAVRPAFGMSETSSGITFLSEGFSLETSSDDMSFVELGSPIPGASIRITEENNQIVAEGVIGKFQVKGLSVTSGYYENPQRNREAFTPDGWFNTGDLGYLQSGRIVLTGRDKDDIIINGINYYSHEIESVVEEVEGVEVSYTAACAVRVGENAEQLAIFFSSTISDKIRVKELIKKIRGTVVKNIGVNPNYIIPVKKEMIPKTAIGKIQRSQLSRMFSDGEFDTIIQQLGINLDNPNLLPDWFYRPSWRRKQPITQIPTMNGQFLIFLDRLGLGESLGTELQNRGQQWIGIEAGVDFKQKSNNRYSVAPNNPEHYQQLLSALKANNFQIDKIIHLWTYESGIRQISSLESLEEAQTHGVYSLLSLVKALSNIHKSHQTIELLVVSNNTQFTSPDEEIAYEKSPLLGLVKVIAQEIPGLTSRHIDLSVDEPAVNAKLILQEMHVLSEESEVAYRHGQRWIPLLEKVNFRAPQKQDVAFKPGGMYLISGGLGGVGVEIAKYLLKHYKVRVLLVGRTSLPSRSTWETYRGHKDSIAQKIAAYQELEQLGGDIAYETVDVCDLQALQQVVEQTLNCWGCQLDGVLHLAGTYQERSLTEENQESWSAALRSKVGGAWVLNELLKNHPQAFVISFSSVSRFLGGATVGAFVCANQFLESFAHYQRTQCGLKSYCFSWSLWDGIGISQDTQRSKLATSKGYCAITPRQGLYSLLVGLHHNQVQLFIGLDGSNRHIRGRVEDTYPLEKLTAYFTASSDSSVTEQLSKLVVRDHFGSPSTCDFVQLQQMPLTQTGTIDREKLTKGNLSELPNDQAQPVTDIERQVAQIWQEVLGLESVGIHDNFFELGGHSLLLVQAQSKLHQLFGSNVSIVDMFKYPSISSLAKYLSQGQTESASVAQGQKRAKVRSQSHAAHKSDIAVIGMSCRFPGANNIDEFWQNLCNGVESISFFTTEEIIATGVDPALVKNPNYVKAKPILSDVESFDADFFGYSTKEAELMDPQQRLLLECAWESLENAGYNPLTYDGAIGIYAGAVMNTYLLNNIYPNRHHLDVNDNLHVATMDSMGGLQMMVANDKDYLTTRISYKLNLTGPSVNVQTACSTSLVAIHMACGSLLSGESDMALAGGVSVNVPQKVGHLYQEGMIVSSDGHCRAFDARAQGTIFGSGAGIVVLKRLEDALADGDNIYAVVKGSAVNNDGGTKVGYMAPNGDGQAAVVTEAMAMAGIDANTISYVEAHGTGTPLGDPIEIGGLTQAFRASTQSKNFCAIGSVKTNVGHLQIASGVVGFMKTVLSLYHKKLPPSLHFDVPNPQLDLPNTPFYVNTTLKDWPIQDYPRRAGVNSLGIGGTNAHVILEEAPSRMSRGAGGAIERPYHLLALSAKNEQALASLQHLYLQLLTSNSEVSVADVCYTANTGREHFNHRLAVVADSREQLVAQLADLTITKSQSPNQKTLKIAFLFTGQGSQYVNMGRQLYESQPLFRQTLQQCDEILHPYLEHSVLEVLYPTQAGEEVSLLLNQTAFTQPALFAFEYALYQLWKSWGIEPDVVMGHSVGEYVAATIAGVFSLEDGLKLIAQRGRLMQQLPSCGEMVSLIASHELVREVIAPFRNTVAIAAINGSESVVISGASEDISTICDQLSTLSVKTKRLEVSHAFHSPLMAPMLKEFEQVANGVTYNQPRIPLVSNVTGKLADENIATAQYWVNHVNQCVLFAISMETSRTLGCEVFLEIGPKPILLGMGRECLPDSALSWLPSVRPGVPEWQQLLSSLGELYVRGVSVDWLGFEGDYERNKVVLPTYPFQRQRYWIENTPPRHPQAQSLSPENIQSPITNFLNQEKTQELVELVQKAGNFSPEQIKLLPEVLAVLVREHKQYQHLDNIQDLCYEVVWRNQGNIQSPPEISDRETVAWEHRQKLRAEHWLIFADNQGIGEQLSFLLRSQQKNCTLVFPGSEYKQIAEQEFTLNPALPEDFQRLVLSMPDLETGSKSLPSPRLHGVVYLWSLNTVEADSLTVTDLEVASLIGCGGVLSLVQSAIGKGFSSPPTLWLVTKGAQRVGVESTLVGVAQSPMWGLGKVITSEHPEFNCTLVDLDPQGNDNAQSLLAEICSPKLTPRETHIAFRNGQRYINRLVRSNKIVKKSLHLKGDSTYLITGGIGGIGLLLAQWLVEHGAKHLVLVGRSKPKEAVQQTLKQLEENGTQIVVIQTDVSVVEEVTSLLTQIKASMPQLRGIIHAAGVVEDRLLVDHQWQLFANVFAPKVSGAWNLHTQTQDIPLDFFVLFSSVASILGSAGIANYAAANAFLDALAHYRKSFSLPGLSINWGPWSMVGMAKTAASKSEVQWASKGIKPIEPQQALDILENLFSIDATQVGVMQLDWSKFFEQFSNTSYPSFFCEIAPQAQKVASTQVVQQKVNTSQLLDQIKAASLEQSQSLLMNYLGEHIARVLGITALSLNVDEPLNKMGLDSLMVVELRNRLRAELEVNIPITKFLDGVNVVGLTQFISEQLVEDNSTSNAPVPSTTTSTKKSRIRGKL
ncbi:SDR family NAD(P)-dependent oxidoreductase [Scytonema sp. UIC 10036]|uniref:type I polyketide synthase n=1 Tax=Scytonema sp. UIC 10036 TaxID=2304196 RepID=UPI0012DA0B21|nr:type I polyketide synthase [Scytonema sp. UIC 10036]MUG96552.1 SDR family NAD(P)-dependent oxidoreductase [Scytonema sp. UIC 10036]